MKKHQHSLSKYFYAIKSQPTWLTSESHFQGKSFDVRSWSFGNFGYFFFLSSLLPGCDELFLIEGDQHRKQRKMLNHVFSTAHMRGMSMYCSFLLNKPTHWRSSSYILWHLLQGTCIIYFFYFAAYSNIILPQSFEPPFLIGSKTDLEKLITFVYYKSVI